MMDFLIQKINKIISQDLAGSVLDVIMARPPIYTINEKYFESTESHEKYYILGFIFSDGSLQESQRGNYSLSFSQQAQDIEVLEFIKKELSSSHPIKTFEIKNRSYVRYNITNKYLVSFLRKQYNITNNKSSNNLTFPDIKEEFLSSFLLGYFDGDGSIWNKSDREYAVSFCGGLNFLQSIQEILKTKININSYIRYRYGENRPASCSLEINGSLQITKLYHYLYATNIFALKRKKDKFIQCSLIAQKEINNNLTLNGKLEIIKNLYNSGMSQKDISIQQQINYSSVKNVVQRLRRKGIITRTDRPTKNLPS